MKIRQVTKTKPVSTKILIKKCHCCGTLMESKREIEKCTKCNKSFLPLNYFSKVCPKNSEDFRNEFASCDELHEEDLIKGITVIW